MFLCVFLIFFLQLSKVFLNLFFLFGKFLFILQNFVMLELDGCGSNFQMFAFSSQITTYIVCVCLYEVRCRSFEDYMTYISNWQQFSNVWIFLTNYHMHFSICLYDGRCRSWIASQITTYMLMFFFEENRRSFRYNLIYFINRPQFSSVWIFHTNYHIHISAVFHEDQSWFYKLIF